MDDSALLLTPRQAARRLALATSTLAKMRLRGDGPPFVKLGVAVRYDSDALDAYVRRLPRHRSTAEYDTPRPRPEATYVGSAAE